MVKKPAIKDVELEPDAWQRFERAVTVVAKSPPQPKKKAAKRKSRKKRQ
jgi:hypothetical protein